MQLNDLFAGPHKDKLRVLVPLIWELGEDARRVPPNRRTAERKNDGTALTPMDLQNHRKFIRRVKPFGVSVISEEGRFVEGPNGLVVVDPIDGSEAYGTGLGVWQVQAAWLDQDGKPLVAAMYTAEGHILWGGLGAGVWLGRERLAKPATVPETILGSGLDYATEPNLMRPLVAFEGGKLVERCIVPTGSSMAAVLMGLAGAAFHNGEAPWDWAPPAALGEFLRLTYTDASGQRKPSLSGWANGVVLSHGGELHDRAVDHARWCYEVRRGVEG